MPCLHRAAPACAPPAAHALVRSWAALAGPLPRAPLSARRAEQVHTNPGHPPHSVHAPCPPCLCLQGRDKDPLHPNCVLVKCREDKRTFFFDSDQVRGRASLSVHRAVDPCFCPEAPASRTLCLLCVCIYVYSLALGSFVRSDPCLLVYKGGPALALLVC